MNHNSQLQFGNKMIAFHPIHQPTFPDRPDRAAKARTSLNMAVAEMIEKIRKISF
jgi:hypothetical protein